MTKRQIIDDILSLNRSAKPEFLSQFDTEELDAYLRHLQLAQTPRLSCVQGQYSKYFQNVPTIPADIPPPEAERQWSTPEPAPVTEPTLFDDDLDEPTDRQSPVRAGSPDAAGADAPSL